MMEREKEKGSKLLEMCDELGLSGEEKEAALKFLSGEADEEILSVFKFRDITEVTSSTLPIIANEFVRGEKSKEIRKLFLLLFAIGEATCYRLIDRTYIGYRRIEGVDPVKRAAVCGMSAGMSNYKLTSYTVTELISVADGRAENIKKALEYKSVTDYGRLVLLTVYFAHKYQNSRKIKAVEKEDFELMQEYEAILMEELCQFYDKHMGEEEKEKGKLLDAIASDRVPQEFLNCKGKPIGRRFRLIAGTAYFNYPLSKKLENIVRICVAVNWRDTLDSIRSVSYGFPLDIGEVGGNFDKVFGIDSKEYIYWAMQKNFDGILKEQVLHNLEFYLSVMEKAGIDDANRMLSYIEPVHPTLYRKLVEEKRTEYRERVIAEITKKDIQGDADAARPYLRGCGKQDSMYICFLGNNKNNFYNGGYDYAVVIGFDRVFKDEQFFRRCEVYMTFRHASYFFRSLIAKQDKKAGEGNKVDPKRVEKVFLDLEKENLPMCYRVQAVSTIGNGLYSNTENDFLVGVMEYFSRCLKENREETAGAFLSADAYARQVGLRLLSQNAEEYKQEILKYAQDSSKAVKEELFKILSAKKNWEKEIKELVNSKKVAEREFAIRVLLSWQKDGADYKEFFAQAMEKEKNAKVREVLGNALGLESDTVKSSDGSGVVSRGEMVKNLHKGNRKRSLLWAYETPFSAVHMTAGEVAAEEYLQAVLLCYTSADGCGVSKNAQFLAEALRADEFAVYVNELFDKWLAAGAESKKRWVLYAAAIHGGSDIITKLERQIKEWPQELRGAIACEAVKALSLSPLPQALLIVDGIARKFKFKQVRAAAGAALEFAASELGITREELADRIVPDLGFDEKMERLFDYGTRAFLVTLTPALEIEVFEAKEAQEGENSTRNLVRGKKLKNLPAPGAKDNAETAKAAYEEFKQMKKQMKEVVASQKLRLEQTLSSARCWSVPAWKQLFVKNPIMHQFAIGLIWGVYKGEKLVQSFRYMEDGSFNTQGEEEYLLPVETEKIGLVHPIELSEEDLKAWKQQLEDYEIIQPFLQLERPVFTPEEEELSQHKLSRFSGRVINDMSLGSRLTGAGWCHGPVFDGGCFRTYYREDKEINFCVELCFSGCFIGYAGEDVTVEDVRFYRGMEAKQACLLREVPAKYFSEITLQVERATTQTKEGLKK